MLYIIIREGCPYCTAAKQNIEGLLRRRPELGDIPIAYLNDTPDTAGNYDYYYTPAYFWDKEKLAEGSFSEETVAEILMRAHNLQGSGTE